MREGIGIVSIFQIVILFLFVFVAIMCFTFNHSKAFAVKDEIVTILEADSLEQYSANTYITESLAKEIADELTALGYHSTGSCPTFSGNDENSNVVYKGYDANGNVTTSSNALFCIRAIDITGSFAKDATKKCDDASGVCTVINQHYPTMVYYDVVVFYTLDIPLLNTILNLNVHSSTKILYGS